MGVGVRSVGSRRWLGPLQGRSVEGLDTSLGAVFG